MPEKQLVLLTPSQGAVQESLQVYTVSEREYVPDGGQEHTTDSDDGLFVSVLCGGSGLQIQDADICTVIFGKPVTQLIQTFGKGRKASLLIFCTTVQSGNADTGKDPGFVDNLIHNNCF